MAPREDRARRGARRLALLLALFAPAALAAPATPADESAGDIRLYTATTEGTLTVDADGRVSAVDVDRRQLGEDLMDAVVAIVRRWRFEPVVDPGGAVTDRMRLSLVAMEVPAQDRLAVTVRGVRFLGQPDGPAAAPAPVPVGPLAMPRYPVDSARAGIGAEVMVLLRLAQDGSVADVAADQVMLFGDPPDAKANRLQAHVAGFVQAATGAASTWRFGTDGDRSVRVPVRFRAPGSTDDHWARTRIYALPAPAWLRAAGTGKPATLEPDGTAIRQRLTLLTPLSGPAAPGG